MPKDKSIKKVMVVGSGPIIIGQAAEFDYAGTIHRKDLPALMRKLIMLKNKDKAEYTRPSSTQQGGMQRTTDPETGMTKISRGATIYDMGVSSQQVNRYVDKLIEIVKFTQEHPDAIISWS